MRLPVAATVGAVPATRSIVVGTTEAADVVAVVWVRLGLVVGWVADGAITTTSGGAAVARAGAAAGWLVGAVDVLVGVIGDFKQKSEQM